MAMDIGPRGGIGYDSDTHRSGTDWNKNGSIDMADGAMNMLVMDHVMKEGDSEQSGQAFARNSTRSSKQKSKLKDWVKHHYVLVTMVVTFVVTFSLCMLFGSK